MNILVVNAGSSSIKYQLFDMDKEKALAKGMVSRIGMSGAIVTHKPFDRPEVKVSGEILDHIAGIAYVISILLSPNHGVIKDKSEIHAVGHRVVHGGERFTESILINSEVLSEIRNLIDIAPLHNPHNHPRNSGLRKTLPGLPQVAVFDTAFHHQDAADGLYLRPSSSDVQKLRYSPVRFPRNITFLCGSSGRRNARQTDRRIENYHLPSWQWCLYSRR